MNAAGPKHPTGAPVRKMDSGSKVRMKVYSAVVVGLGAMGAATLYQLAARGALVLGIDRYGPPHDLGSSHGDTRVTRLAIGEGWHLTPLVKRSHELWRQVERETGAELLTKTGGLIISSAGRTATTHVANFFENTLAAARDHSIAHEVLNASEIRRRFPQFAVRDDEIGYFEPEAGFVRPEAAIRAELRLARKFGAEVHTKETYLSWRREGKTIRVTTDKGEYRTKKLILAAGPWLPEILGEEFRGLFRVLRQVLFWFDVPKHIERFLPDRSPVFIWELQTGAQVIYGFPAVDGARGGVKIATEQYDAETTPDAIDRAVSDDEIRAMHTRHVAPFLPDLSPVCVRAATCLYTVTPDAGFIIDRHPESDAVIVVSACSGHGFKHSAAIGEALAELCLDGVSRLDLSPFRLGRFAP